MTAALVVFTASAMASFVLIVVMWNIAADARGFSGLQWVPPIVMSIAWIAVYSVAAWRLFV